MVSMILPMNHQHPCDVSVTKMTTTGGSVTFDITSFMITELKSNMAGFSVIQSTKDAIHEVFSKGVIIPSQQLDYATFPIAPYSSGINSTFQLVISLVYQLCYQDMIKTIPFSRILAIIISSKQSTVEMSLMKH